MNDNFINGFIKRASEYGLNIDEAVSLFKQYNFKFAENDFFQQITGNTLNPNEAVDVEMNNLFTQMQDEGINSPNEVYNDPRYKNIAYNHRELYGNSKYLDLANTANAGKAKGPVFHGTQIKPQQQIGRAHV